MRSRCYTHTRQLVFHPHGHPVVPAAAIATERWRWRCKRRRGKVGYLFNAFALALAKVFRGKMLAGIAVAGRSPPARHPPKWVARC